MNSTASNIVKLSSELIDCANKMARAQEEEEEEEEGEGEESQQITMENTELLRRDWASQVRGQRSSDSYLTTNF